MMSLELIPLTRPIPEEMRPMTRVSRKFLVDQPTNPARCGRRIVAIVIVFEHQLLDLFDRGGAKVGGSIDGPEHEESPFRGANLPQSLGGADELCDRRGLFPKTHARAIGTSAG